jgi:putative ABC transport system permease protein
MVRDAMETIPEVKYATRVTPGGRRRLGHVGADFNSPEGQNAVRAESLYADSHFFDVFSFKILQGEPGEALSRRESVYLTPEVARALLEDQDSVGQAIAVQGIENAQVVGIVEAPPANSHIQFEMIVPLIPEINPQYWDSWETLALRGYVLLEENADPALVATKMKDNA